MKLVSKIKLVLGAAAAGLALSDARADTYRTDINPALLCYQALILRPNLSDRDRDYLLLTNDWQGQHLDARFAGLIAGYDNEFKLLRRAAHSKVPCDWGIDLSDGAGTLLPHLAYFKGAAQAACLRALWDLQNRNPNEGRDDLMAAFVLGRNSSRDATLISCLVQAAIENLLCSFVAENYGRFPAQTLQELVNGFDAAPVQRMVAECIPTERQMFGDGWIIPKIRAVQQAYPGDDGPAWKAIVEIFTLNGGSGEGAPNSSGMEELAKASGGTSDGVIKLVRDLSPFYDRFAMVLALPYSEYGGRMAELAAKIQKSTNPLAHDFLPALEKCRNREFVSLVKVAMVRAAVKYKLEGEQGLKQVMDPCGNGPFRFEPFVFDGRPRGFKLTSTYAGPGFNSLIFVETQGARFYIEGKNIGQPLPKN